MDIEWRVQLGSAFRTTVACGLVGCAAVYGPRSLLGQIPFPAFSYLTAVLIVCDATLGDALHGIWHAFYATVQVVPASVLILWAVGSGRFTPGMAAVGAGLSSFVVALPESTHIMTKKIAFGQIVIVYVGVIVHSDNTKIFMHPIHVAASTALGALAAVLALLVPIPRLASFEVSKLCRAYAENASKRIGVFVKAFSSRANSTVTDSLSQDKPFAETGAKLLQRLEVAEEGMMWERPKNAHLKTHFANPVDELKDMEMPIRGMRIALSSCNSFPTSIINQEVSDVLLRLKMQKDLKLEQVKCFLHSDAATAPEMEEQPLDYSLKSLKTITPTLEDLWAFFFLFCMKLLQDDSTINQETESPSLTDYKPKPDELIIPKEQDKCSFKRICNGWIMRPRTETLVFASKCAFPLGLAVLFGLIFNKPNGYWSGLMVAISFAQGRQATFTVVNARLQGTAMGSAYGVVCCFIFERFAKVRFLGLLPWFIFTSFLRHSRMYGQSGGMSAIIGAILILGRRNYGTPHEFAIVRLAEVFVGLFCLVMAELLLQPTRAASLAKSQLSQCLRALQECIEEIGLRSGQKDMPASVFPALREKQKQLKTHVNELEKLRGEAELEPDFWFLPFRGACYGKLIKSLSRMADLLHFVAYRMEFLLLASQGCGLTWRELQEHFNSDLELFRTNVGSSLKCLEHIVLMKSLAVRENEMQDKKRCQDLELGESLYPNLCYLRTDDEEIEKILSSFLQHSKELTTKIQDNRHEELKGQMDLCLSALGFCIGDLMRETKEIENGIKELTQWENPTSCINFHDISCRSTAPHL